MIYGKERDTDTEGENQSYQWRRNIFFKGRYGGPERYYYFTLAT